MKVTLLNSYNSEQQAQQAAAICIGKFDTASDNNLQGAVSRGHESVLEHLYLTFRVSDVSVSMTHQLVRSRMASYSQKSLRYTKLDIEKQYEVDDVMVIPSEILDNYIKDRYNCRDFYKVMYGVIELYLHMLESGVPAEDARYVLPQGAKTDIIVSMNARSFIKTCETRLCNMAHWEIRQMFEQAKEAIKDVYPTVYKLCKPKCKYCKETKPCNRRK